MLDNAVCGHVMDDSNDQERPLLTTTVYTIVLMATTPDTTVWPRELRSQINGVMLICGRIQDLTSYQVSLAYRAL